MDFNLHQVSEDQWISNLAKNPGLSLLAVDGFGKLVLLHNVSYLQENLFCSESKILGLCGSDDLADVYRIDPKTASSTLEIPVPTWRDLKGTQSSGDVETLVVADQNPTMARFKNSFWVPPLVSVSILEAKSLLPAELIPLLLTKFQEFDKSSTTVKACTVLRPTLEFLWAVYKKLVPPTTLAVDTSRDASEWASRQHFAYISPVVPLPPPPLFPVPPPPSVVTQSSPFQSMTEELRKIREANEKQLLRESQSGEMKKESNGWEKLPDMVQNMILKMSATQDDILPLDRAIHIQKS